MRKANVLLMKDDVGRSKPSTRILPGQGFTYGKPEIRDAEGADRVVSSWKNHASSNLSRADKDFQKLNKLSLNSKATTAKEMYEFRKGSDTRLRNPLQNIKHHNRLPDDDFSYGKALRPSTPIREVIGNFFGDQSELEMSYKLQQREHMERNVSRQHPRKHTTKSQIQATYIKEKEASKATQAQMFSSFGLFKMKKFANVEARTNTNNRAKSAMKRH